jgi:hypothetical protein
MSIAVELASQGVAVAGAALVVAAEATESTRRVKFIANDIATCNADGSRHIFLKKLSLNYRLSFININTTIIIKL